MPLRLRKNRLVSGVSAYAVLMALAGSALAQSPDIPDSATETEAQTTGQPPPSTASAPTVLAPVEVTARKRVENAQEVPISITTITAGDIQDTGLENMEDVVRLTPGFNAMHGAQSWGSTFNVRGVGSLNPGGHEDGSISAYVDGIPVPMGQLDTYYLDIDQVEVLRGPQGTLYGKTSQAGAINITTVAPSDTFEGRLGVGIGTGGTRGIDGVVSGPILKDRLNGRLVFDLKSEDGLMYAQDLGRDLGDVDRAMVRGTFDATWNDRASTRLSLGYDVLDNNDQALAERKDYDKFMGVFEPYEDRTHASLGMTNTFDLTDNVTLNLVTGAHLVDLEYASVPNAMITGINKDGETHFSQEVRLDGTANRLDWTAGGFLSQYHRDIDMKTTGLLSFVDSGEQEISSQAIFGEATYAVLDDVKVTTGLRLNRDNKSIDETVVNNTYGFTHTMDEDKAFYGWNGRVALAYTPTKTDTFFASISRGYKAGGFQTNHSTAMSGLQENTPSFDSTTSISYEVGYKGFFLDERLNIEGSAYYISTSGEQVLGYDTTTYKGIYHNVDAESMGLELSSRARLTEELTLGGSLAYTHAYITQDADLGVSGFASAGSEIPNVPKVAYTVFAEYRDDLPESLIDASWFVRVDFRGQTGRWFDITHDYRGDSFATTDLRLGLDTDGWSVNGYVTNVTDEKYYAYGMLNRVRPAEEREFGLKVNLFF
ncbi:TonB-dependent receptor [Rhodospirillum rubrum]|uniref:TonB-dependent receptor n=1 Tax=Rhodospirillum rubrum TaxID=1085 RepID=UPI001905C761|nr:TonB-dependent receptor [Rhodospirillum rubrum]MBK1666179.1 TonB-dependent receptor [Rhodospirillum rubrum]MBK1678293.1 TonB-dependent receptor [Rhodospirillum rubrum]